MTYETPCDNCGCGLADENTGTQKADVEAGMDFSAMLRNWLEKNSDIDQEDRIQKVEVCPEEVVAYIEDDD